MITIMDIPNRESDAGPETVERPTDWRDELAAATEEIEYAAKVYRDDIGERDRLRRTAIEDAIQLLQGALVLLPDAPKSQAQIEEDWEQYTAELGFDASSYCPERE